MNTREALDKYLKRRRDDIDWDASLEVAAQAALKVAGALDECPASSTAANLGRELRALLDRLAPPEPERPDVFDLLQAELRGPDLS